MSRKEEIREFLTSRRANVTPAEVSLPDFGDERRVPGLRREEVAELAGVSTDYYTRLERGNIQGASDSVLNAIARALRLTDVEREHLFALARPVSPRERQAPARTVRPSLQRMLDSFTTPAVIYDVTQEIIASNVLGRALFAPHFESERPNMARFIFLDSRAPEFYLDWPMACSMTAATLRLEVGRDPLNEDLTALIGELSTRSPQFRRDWADNDVHEHRTGTKGYRHTVVSLLAEATARGLTTVPTPKRPSGPVGRSTFFSMLRNPYYIGIVRYKGAEQSGAHEPLVDVETWQQVQRLLDSRKIADERRRTHDHYLKGSLFCGQCGSRMQLDYPANKQGVRYAYYVCSGRASKRKNCTRRAVPVGIAEQLVADCYRDISITEEQYAALAAQVEAAFDERLASRSQELAELTENRKRLQNESDKLLAAHFADAIDLETLKRHQDRIRAGLADIDRRLASEHDQHESSRKHLSTALSLLVDCATLYARTDDQGKRLANQALTNGIEISEDERATIKLAEPFAALAPTPVSTDVRCSSTSEIVELGGFEPPTFSLRTRRATNCAIAPSARQS